MMLVPRLWRQVAVGIELEKFHSTRESSALSLVCRAYGAPISPSLTQRFRAGLLLFRADALDLRTLELFASHLHPY
jgi:hypothetical protein